MSREHITGLPAILEAGLPPMLEEDLALEKSWYGRLGLQDLIAESPRTIDFLTEHAQTLSDDLTVVRDSSRLILEGFKTIPVGEGGTWARLLSFASAKYGWDLTLIKSGTLKGRPDEFRPEHVTAPLTELRTLNRNSSQVASAAVLCGSTEPMPDDAPYHLRMSYEAREYWRTHQGDRTWDVRKDSTFRRQAIAWIGWLMTDSFLLDSMQPEDYPIKRVFGTMKPEDAVAIGWDSLAGHESNRFTDLEEAIVKVRNGEEVTLRDHRPLIALDWRHGTYVRIKHREAIGKSWELTQFTRFSRKAREFAAQAA